MRVTTVDKARKDAGRCSKCGDALPVGSSYRWIKNRYGPRRVVCTKSECHFTRADMTTSDKLARLYGAQDDAERALSDTFESIEDIRSALDEAASTAREVGEEYRESASNIESGFGNRTSMCDELDEKADVCDNWADELENALNSLDEWDDSAARGDALDELIADSEEGVDSEKLTDEQEQALNEAVDEKLEEWREGVRDTVTDAIGNLEL